MITAAVIYLWCKIPGNHPRIIMQFLGIVMLTTIALGLTTDIGIAMWVWRKA